MKIIFQTIIICLLISCNSNKEPEKKTLSDQITVDFLRENISSELPRMIFTKNDIELVKQKINDDSLVHNIYNSIKCEAEKTLKTPTLKRELEGRRLLGVSREFLKRINELGTVYLIKNDSNYLNRINEEVLAVSSFSDWNPDHFLDVAEILMGMSFALDWTVGKLPESTIQLAKNAIIEKGLKPGIDTSNKDWNWWHSSTMNWNQVCFGGMIAGAIAVFEENPELTTQIINYSTKKLHLGMEVYAPDGIYPEGPSYWAYGTSYTILTSSLLGSSVGTDFGLKDFKGFMQSPIFILKSIAPSGNYFNFSDCGDNVGAFPYILLTWFANETGDKSYINNEKLCNINNFKIPRISAPSLVWISNFKESSNSKIPNNWVGKGENPVAFITSNKNKYYFACKGGSASLNHANMDAGSFIFETDGIRWSVDPGTQNYNNLEKHGFDLWNKSQDSERWTLLTKNNFGHSTLTVNGELHKVEGNSQIINFTDDDTASVSVNLTPQFGADIDSAVRTFIKPNSQSLIIEDFIVPNDSTKAITWQMMTTADVELKKGGVILSKDGKKLALAILSHPELSLNMVSLSPPPLRIDKDIDGLKRIEINIQEESLKDTIRLIVELNTVL